jgi:hypothetical protein
MLCAFISPPVPGAKVLIVYGLAHPLQNLSESHAQQESDKNFHSRRRDMLKTMSGSRGFAASRKYSIYFCVGSSIFLMRSCNSTSRGIFCPEA